MSDPTVAHLRQVAVDRPITALCVLALAPTLALQTALLLAGVNLFPGKLTELVLLTAVSTLITFWIGGRSAVGHLYGGLTKWRIGAGRWALVLMAMPILTMGVAAATGTLHTPKHGWTGEIGIYLVLFALIALTGSLWEETTWSGFVQLRLMDRHGLFVGSMLTAIPFGVIHLPLAFETKGWADTTWSEAFFNWAFLLGALPFFRYVIGVLLVDTGGSVLAAAMLHASFNASGAMSVVPDGWQYVPALVILSVLVAVHRRLSGRAPARRPVDASGVPASAPASAPGVGPERHALVRKEPLP
jgi:membrane protease YdiL (CAAX protease family)